MSRRSHSPACPQVRHGFIVFFIQTAAVLVAVATTLILYNASVDDEPLSEKFDFSINRGKKIGLFFLAFLAGINEYVDMLDHLEHRNQDHSTTDPNTSADHPTLVTTKTPLLPGWQGGSITSISQKERGTCQETILSFFDNKYVKLTIKSMVTIVATPFLVAACIGLFFQSKSLISSIDNSASNKEKILFALIPTAISVLRFVTIPVIHTWKNIWGGQHKYTAKVIGVDEINKVSPLRKVLIFLLLCATHLAESWLLSEGVSQELGDDWIWLQYLSIIGLTSARAVAHLDHFSGFSKSYQKWQDYPCRYRALTLFTAFISASAHAAPASLGTWHYWSKDTSFLSITKNTLMTASAAIEFFTGGLEHIQHGGRKIKEQGERLEQSIKEFRRNYCRSCCP